MLQSEATTSIFIEQFQGNGACQSRVSKTLDNKTASRPDTKEIGSKVNTPQGYSPILTDRSAKSVDTNFSLNLEEKHLSSLKTANVEARYTMKDMRIAIYND